MILALDPSSKTNGYGLLRRHAGELVLLSYGVIKLKAHRVIEQRLFDLRASISDLVRGTDFHAEDVRLFFAVERAFAGRFPAVALSLGRLDGVIRELCWEITGRPAITLTANEVRRIIGSKTKETTKRILEEHFSVNLTECPYDTSDAIALGWAAFTRLPKEEELWKRPSRCRDLPSGEKQCSTRSKRKRKRKE